MGLLYLTSQQPLQGCWALGTFKLSCILTSSHLAKGRAHLSLLLYIKSKLPQDGNLSSPWQVLFRYFKGFAHMVVLPLQSSWGTKLPLYPLFLTPQEVPLPPAG